MIDRIFLNAPRYGFLFSSVCLLIVILFCGEAFPLISTEQEFSVFYFDEQHRPVTKIEGMGEMSEGVRAILAMYALQVGAGCEGRDDEGLLHCALPESLGLGAQCSEQHLGLVHSWFRKGLPPISRWRGYNTQRALQSAEVESLCYKHPYTATQQQGLEIIRVKKTKQGIIVNAIVWSFGNSEGLVEKIRYETEYQIDVGAVDVVTHKELNINKSKR